jgi:hypothetical protein
VAERPLSCVCNNNNNNNTIFIARRNAIASEALAEGESVSHKLRRNTKF